jgi:hypothetical protein
MTVPSMAEDARGGTASRSAAHRDDDLGRTASVT